MVNSASAGLISSIESIAVPITTSIGRIADAFSLKVLGSGVNGGKTV